jgi:group I intron endonuclease
MGYIYKVTNTINNKIYIGQTKYSVAWRWHTHLYATFTNTAGDHNSLLHKAIRKYGIDAFKVEIIEQCNNKDLNEAEIKYIKKFKSADKDFGYNISLGGGGLLFYRDEDIKKLWDDGYAASEIARLLPQSIGRNTVRLRLLGMGVNETEIRKRGCEAISRSKHKLIYQYTKDGKYIKSFYSAKEASKETKSNPANIAMCANGEIKSAGGYQWSYEKVDHLKPIKKIPVVYVGKYSTDGKLLEIYISLSWAAKNNNISRKKLAMVCENEEFYKGYIWKPINTERGIIHVQ